MTGTETIRFLFELLNGIRISENSIRMTCEQFSVEWYLYAIRCDELKRSFRFNINLLLRWPVSRFFHTNKLFIFYIPNFGCHFSIIGKVIRIFYFLSVKRLRRTAVAWTFFANYFNVFTLYSTLSVLGLKITNGHHCLVRNCFFFFFFFNLTRNFDKKKINSTNCILYSGLDMELQRTNLNMDLGKYCLCTIF